MFWKRLIASTAALVLGCAVPAAAQPDVDALIFGSPGARGVSIDACAALKYTWVWTQTEESYLQFMQLQQWDLVIFEMPKDLVTKKEEVAGLLEDHVAAGGRLLINFNNLDEWPRLQRLLGIDQASERPIPEDVVHTDPPHPSYPFSHAGWFFPWIADPWPDRGDYLLPDKNSLLAAIFESENGAVVIANNEHTIVNGFDWDSYPGGAGYSLAKYQIEYLMRCPADFDQSTGQGVLDIFDFLEFQRLFVDQDYRANMLFDPNLDIFDFLAFQDAFVTGCR